MKVLREQSELLIDGFCKKKMDRRWPRCLNPRTEDPGEGERKEVNSICDC